MAAQHGEIFEDILTARGGRAAFTTETLAIASALAHASLRAAEGDASAAGSIPALIALLPPMRKSEAADWSRLTDGEFQIIKRLLYKMHAKDYIPPKKPPRSKRTRGALRLRDVLDAIEQRIASSGKPFHDRPTPSECHDAYCALSPLLIDCHITVEGLLDVAGVWPSAEARTVAVPPVEACR
jgi:hypothetical protein